MTQSIVGKPAEARPAHKDSLSREETHPAETFNLKSQERSPVTSDGGLVRAAIELARATAIQNSYSAEKS